MKWQLIQIFVFDTLAGMLTRPRHFSGGNNSASGHIPGEQIRYQICSLGTMARLKKISYDTGRPLVSPVCSTYCLLTYELPYRILYLRQSWGGGGGRTPCAPPGYATAEGGGGVWSSSPPACKSQHRGFNRL